jgi:antitoxin CptB
MTIDEEHPAHQSTPPTERACAGARRRGLLENDIILTRFLDAHETN